MRYEITKEFQFTDPKMQVLSLPIGQTFEKLDEDWYIFKYKNKEYQIPSKIVLNNPQIFKAIDWRIDLLSWMKSHKKSTLPAQHKVIVEFFDNHVIKDKDLVSQEDMKILLSLARDKYNLTGDKSWIDLYDRLGWSFDSDKIWKKY